MKMYINSKGEEEFECNDCSNLLTKEHYADGEEMCLDYQVGRDRKEGEKERTKSLQRIKKENDRKRRQLEAMKVTKINLQNDHLDASLPLKEFNQPLQHIIHSRKRKRP